MGIRILISIAINGFGRIGKNIARLLLQDPSLSSQINLVAINDLGSIESSAHLLMYDSVHGKTFNRIQHTEDTLIVDEHEIFYSSLKDPSALPWGKYNIDIVLECSGAFTSKDAAIEHIHAGAKRVIVSAPVVNADKTVVFGVNQHELLQDDLVISNGSCTTNCLAPIAKVLNDSFGINSGIINTIHAYTNDQNLLDMSHDDLYRARATNSSIIPTKTGAAKAIGLVLPELSGKLTGIATRVPVQNVSMLDFTFTLDRSAELEEIKSLFEAAASSNLKNILTINTKPLVSIDFNQNSASAILDFNFINKIGNQFKLIAWYDNEWAFSARMLDLTLYLYQLSLVEISQINTASLFDGKPKISLSQ